MLSKGHWRSWVLGWRRILPTSAGSLRRWMSTTSVWYMKKGFTSRPLGCRFRQLLSSRPMSSSSLGCHLNPPHLPPLQPGRQGAGPTGAESPARTLTPTCLYLQLMGHRQSQMPGWFLILRQRGGVLWEQEAPTDRKQQGSITSSVHFPRCPPQTRVGPQTTPQGHRGPGQGPSTPEEGLRGWVCIRGGVLASTTAQIQAGLGGQGQGAED